MNYLAHLLLTSGNDRLLVGGLLGDFVKGAVGDDYHPQIRCGIVHHRKVDAYTDAHAITRAGKRRFQNGFRRFAGIITDIAYDHFLARSWSQYCQITLPQFVAKAYQVLRCHRAVFHGRSRDVVTRMIEQDWLSSYASLDVVAGALAGVSRRLSRPNPLAQAIEEVERLYEPLEDDFHRFFPQLMAYSRQVEAEVLQTTRSSSSASEFEGLIFNGGKVNGGNQLTQGVTAARL